MCRAKSFNRNPLMSCRNSRLPDCWCFINILKCELLIVVSCSNFFIRFLMFKLLQLLMLVKVFVYKYVNKPDHTSIFVLPYFILFRPMLVNQDFIKADYILFTSAMVLWDLLVELYCTLNSFSAFLMLLYLMS